MDWQSIFTFLTTGPSDRVLGIVVAFLIFAGIADTVFYYVLDSFFEIFKKLFDSIKRKDKIVEVPKYVTPPENKEADKYLALLKKIVDEHNSSVRL